MRTATHLLLYQRGNSRLSWKCFWEELRLSISGAETSEKWSCISHKKMKAEEKRICRSTICWWVAVVTHPVRPFLLCVAFSIPHLYLQASLTCVNAGKAVHGTKCVRVHALTWCMQKVWCSKAWSQQDDVVERSLLCLCFSKNTVKTKNL